MPAHSLFSGVLEFARSSFFFFSPVRLALDGERLASRLTPFSLSSKWDGATVGGPPLFFFGYECPTSLLCLFRRTLVPVGSRVFFPLFLSGWGRGRYETLPPLFLLSRAVFKGLVVGILFFFFSPQRVLGVCRAGRLLVSFFGSRCCPWPVSFFFRSLLLGNPECRAGSVSLPPAVVERDVNAVFFSFFIPRGWSPFFPFFFPPLDGGSRSRRNIFSFFCVNGSRPHGPWSFFFSFFCVAKRRHRGPRRSLFFFKPLRTRRRDHLPPPPPLFFFLFRRCEPLSCLFRSNGKPIGPLFFFLVE